jgi:hypothetical protein
MKTVFDNYDCIHTFAQQTQNNGRTSNSNIFFEGNKIYSYGYHYLLGEFIDKNTILINDKGYSHSTNRHISILRGATSQYRQFYKTKTDINYLHTHILSYLKIKLAKARKPQIYLSEIYYLNKTLNTFLEYTKQKTKAKKNKKYREIVNFVNKLKRNEATSIEALQQYRKKEVEQRKKQDAKQLKEKLSKFEAYEINYFRVGKNDYLRISKDGTKIETSQGVKIDIQEAQRYLKLLNSGANMRGEKISNFVTRSFDKLLKIGCHTFDPTEIKRISKSIK